MDFKFRGYDPRIARFKGEDPLQSHYPWNSAYAFAENDVIRCKDLEGRERLDVVQDQQPVLGTPGVVHITISMDYQVVTNGPGAVNTTNIDAQAFHNIYAGGNTIEPTWYCYTYRGKY